MRTQRVQEVTVHSLRGKLKAGTRVESELEISKELILDL